jgi:hypothetical protein
VNNTTAGKQTPWESSSLTSDFYFFGDTAVASTHAPERGPMIQTASNLPSRSVQQAYDYVLSEGSPEYYEEFIRLFPYDPLCDRIRFLLGNWRQAWAWHRAVLANSPTAYKSFRDSFPNSPYAVSALKLQGQPKNIPLMQFTRLAKPTANISVSHNHAPSLASSTVTLPGMRTNAANSINSGKAGKIRNLPAKTNNMTHATPLRGKNQFHDSGERRGFGGGMSAHSGPRFSQSRGAFGSMGRGGGFRRCLRT